jgi:hypothetical protein
MEAIMNNQDERALMNTQSVPVIDVAPGGLPVARTELPTNPLPDPELEGIEDVLSQSPDEPSAVEANTPSDLISHGYIRVYRIWRQQWWWTHKPWSYAQLFMWFLMEANHQSRTHEYSGNIISIPRGSVYTSQTSLAAKAGVDRTTIARFLKKMEQANELHVTHVARSGIIVMVCNYDAYMSPPNAAQQRARQ